MHPTSTAILSMVKGSQDYSLDVLKQDLFPSDADNDIMTREQIAGIYKVNIRTVDNWIVRYPAVSIKLGTKSRRIYKSKLHNALTGII